MKTVALIPARLNSTRLPKKLVQDLGGKSVIQRTYLSTLGTGLFDEVWVVTDSSEIEGQIKELGGNVFISRKEHESGSDRIAEALEEVEADLVVNVQGDEPFQDKPTLKSLIEVFRDEKVKMASLKTKISSEKADNPNVVKVVTNSNNEALYFSRSKIPFNRDNSKNVHYWKHLGIYAYRKEALLKLTSAPKSALEQVEMLEQLRAFDLGLKIKMVETSFQPIAIDTQEDLEKAINKFSLK
ncbi:3-deoxy-manno-octulosonate cytidylyltransferase [Algoriphagus sediminis]|uniref:3-deoxy-manno-octulosonate cytidylyltransferase n=1 Tax=Algoriphagus sediminis TaxID=3057113 RepID=A0ABT7YDU2_9BACT|nr:3-deoxy-manno-octulosonate cytidylyltransferase [Algoriphagus sediminis]MDN3204679.1 3-deoxy-manno-octulosonate cytidylyltransferase [Algoriphagus sediminis]